MMEELLHRVENLDNVQLRTELLKHGDKVGPVTPSTRKVFVSRLAKKLFAIEHPGLEAAEPNTIICQPGISAMGGPIIPVIQRQGGILLTEKGEEEKRHAPENDSQSIKKAHPPVYYLVILTDTTISNRENRAAHRVFTEKPEAFAFMKKNTGSRLKLFYSESEVKQFCMQSARNSQDSSYVSSKPKMSDDSSSLPVDGEKSAFKGPKIQELVQFRKQLEKGELDWVKQAVWANPRYLISSADTPVILHEGMRHNALHIAAKSNHPGAVSLVLEAIENPEFTRMLYSSSHDTPESRQRRIEYLVDLYLNSPDKGAGESPLHIACKMCFAAVVQALVMHSATDRGMVNKFSERPEDIICSRGKGDTSPDAKERIRELLKGLCLVPLLRSEDNITVPVVGLPCSPDEKLRLQGPALPTPHSAKDPRLTLSAYAGPMSPSKAQEFHKQWSNPRFLRQTLDAGELAARRADLEKGYERIGRKLARELRIQWTEYWQFLDAFADFSSPDGLQKLESHLRRQQALLVILSAMDSAAPPGSGPDENSADSCEDDSSQENYFSCDEGSADDSKGKLLSDSFPASHSPAKSVCAELSAEESDGESDVFEDSLGPDDFFDLSGGGTQKYLFGQRLLLTGTGKSSDGEPQINPVVHGANSPSSCVHKAVKERTQTLDVTADSSKLFTDSTEGSRSVWSYRDTMGSGEELNVCAMSPANDTTKSFDANCSSDVDVGETHFEGCDNSLQNDIHSHVSLSFVKPQNGEKVSNSDDPDKSFNTLMTELSEDLECKLVFSPDGKVIKSNKRRIVPDTGVILAQKLFPKGHLDIRKGKPAMDVLIKSVHDNNTFTADILLHVSTLPAENDKDPDMSLDDVHMPLTKNVHVDIKVVSKNDAVHDYIKRMIRPTLLTVGLLEEEEADIRKNYRCVTARLIRAKRKRKPQHMSCFIYGSRPSKTDLDVMRAMCDYKVDGSVFPMVQSWFGLVTATKQEEGDSWPSPSRLRYQHRLSQLQNCHAFLGSHHPVSPLVPAGAVTSTPVSRDLIPTRRDLSAERLTQTTPRAWLFKSPT